MLFYIFLAFKAFAILLLLVVLIFTLARGIAKKQSWKEILKRVFIRGGMIAILYIVLFYLIGYGFMYQYKKECSPNQEDVAIMKPMAEKIANYIVINGIPKSLKDIPELPYQLKDCKQLEQNDEKCLFIDTKRTYTINFYLFTDNYYSLKLHTRATNTGLSSGFKFNTIQKIWRIDGEMTEYSDKTTGICNPMKQ